jgi:hypothetical protein
MGYATKSSSGGTLSKEYQDNATINTNGKVDRKIMTYSYGIAPVFQV